MIFFNRKPKKGAYAELGVSNTKDAIREATKNNDKGLFPYAFCKINPLELPPLTIPGDSYVMIAHGDGAGTKTSMAYLYWRETGDASVWADVVQDSIVMNLDDVICAGGIDGAMSLVALANRNPFRVPDEVVADLINGENKFLKNLESHNVKIIGQQGETADVPDLTPTTVLDNALFCIMRKSDVIDNANIREGNWVVGLASNGQAFYEDKYNSGIRSNGLTLARHGLLHKRYRRKYPETFEKKLGKKAYRGSWRVGDPVLVETGDMVPMGKNILSPTRTYAMIMRAIYDAFGGNGRIAGAVHNSGGGMTKVLNHLEKPLVVVKDNLFKTPTLFTMIREETKTAWEEMYQTFNMGVGLELYVRDQATANRIIEISRGFGVNAGIIGRVEKAKGDKSCVSIFGEHGAFDYSR
ncbi:MAG: AIR synthase-related protein [Alphaproteobacteria bacterium]|nr:AIR synthase-related protein [Alphaproteobacteria bacterium]